jgi:hypothetical protein
MQQLEKSLDFSVTYGAAVFVNVYVLQRFEPLLTSRRCLRPAPWLLAEVIGKHGPFEFILAEPARCPNCKHEITEKTLTDPGLE